MEQEKAVRIKTIFASMKNFISAFRAKMNIESSLSLSLSLYLSRSLISDLLDI